MTTRQHRLWLRVARLSKLGRWYRPVGSDRSVLSSLFRRGYFQRRRADGAYRLAGLWPRDIWPPWARREDRQRREGWWPPWVPFRAPERIPLSPESYQDADRPRSERVSDE